MKIVLMIAAGVAVGLTVVMAILVQVLQQLTPLLVVLVAAGVVWRLVGRCTGPRRPGRGDHRLDEFGEVDRLQRPPGSAISPSSDYEPGCAPEPQVAALSEPTAHPETLPYLQWGSVDHHSLATPLLPFQRPSTGSRRGRAGARPPARSGRVWR